MATDNAPIDFYIGDVAAAMTKDLIKIVKEEVPDDPSEITESTTENIRQLIVVIGNLLRADDLISNVVETLDKQDQPQSHDAADAARKRIQILFCFLGQMASTIIAKDPSPTHFETGVADYSGGLDDLVELVDLINALDTLAGIQVEVIEEKSDEAQS